MSYSDLPAPELAYSSECAKNEGVVDVSRSSAACAREHEEQQQIRGAANGQSGWAPVLIEPLPPDNELWNIGAAARFLKLSKSWIYHHVEDGTLPCVRVHGWALRFVPAELRAWIEKNGSRRNVRGRNKRR